MSNKKSVLLYAVIVFVVLSLIMHLTLALILNKSGDTTIDSRLERDYVLDYENYVFNDNGDSVLLPFPSENEKYARGNYKYKELYYPLVAFYDNEIKQKYYDFYQAIPHLATSKYFSIEARFYLNVDATGNNDSVFTFVTIDLEKKEVVLLKDLVNTNDDFIKLLKEGNIIKTDTPKALNEEFGAYSDFSLFSLEEIRELVDLCSVYSDADNCSTKPSFFLAPGRLYFGGFNEVIKRNSVYINLDDIEQFLKVEKW